MTPLRLAFFGTPDFAVPSLRAVADSPHTVVAVVTQPDRPRGRGQKFSPSPVKTFAEQRDLPVYQPERLKDDSFLRQFEALSTDLAVVAAYGKILPASLLSLPRLGFVNVHASLLPRWRGASPVHRAVMAGDAETGVSIMRVVQALDAGGVLATASRAIGPDENTEEVERDLADLGARELLPVIAALDAGTAREVPQDESRVTYAPRLTKEEGLITWTASAAAIHNQVRGLYPWPHAYSLLEGARVIVLRTAIGSTPGPSAVGAEPGRVLEIRPDGVVVAAGDGRSLWLLQLQAEGRRSMPARDFAAGARLTTSSRFGA